MPRLRKPPGEQSPPDIIEQPPLPTEPIEVEIEADDSGEVTVDLAPTPKDHAPPAAEPKPDDDPLQKAIAGQQRAEELQREAQRRHDDLLRRSQQRDAERDAEIVRERGEREDAQYTSVLTAIGAEQATADKAQGDYATAMSTQDWNAAAEAQRRLSTATARLVRLEDNKAAFEVSREAAKTEPKPEPQRPTASPAPTDFEGRLAALSLPDQARDWLRKHPEFVTDNAKNREIGGVDDYIVNRKRIERFTPAYFDALDSEFEFKAPAAPNPPPQQIPPKRSMPVSAPVSRGVVSPSGATPTKMTLRPDEVEIARSSRPDLPAGEAERLYAKNKQRLAAMRGNGSYPQPERN